MSFIGGPLPNLNSSSSSSGGMYGGAEPGINTDSRSQRNQQRYARFSEGLRRAAAYKDKKAAENEADKEDDDEEKTGNYGPKGFKISPDSTVVSGYTDPGFTLQGVQGRSVLGAVGAGLTPFFPVTGQAIGAVGSLTGI
tara:strand:- start:177 stop:593 length:417 start_codon:yes stop_codon:yes gene_type:complete